MSRLLALIALASLLACAQPQPADPDVDPDRADPAAREWSIDLPQSGKLAENDVETSTTGPWTVRRTVSPGNSAMGSATKEKLLRGRLSGGGDTGGSETEDHGAGDDGVREEMKHGEAPPPPSAGAPSPADSSDGYRGPAGEAEPVADPAEETLAARPGEDSTSDRRITPKARGAAVQSPLKAGSTDDNEKFDEFVEFLVAWSDRADTAGLYDMLDVRDRAFVRVVNAAGSPVPSARVSVVDEAADRVLLRGTTYGDGRVPFYPRVANEAGGSRTVADGGADDFLVEVSFGELSERVRWDGESDLSVALDVAQPIADPVHLDVLFLIDTTGSMGDEIARVKQSLLSVTQKLRSLSREFDLRYSMVLYRDVGDEYVTKSHPFTGDIEAFDAALQTIRAAGGGDGPESLNQGMAEAVGRADWRAGAAKVMFLIADAPPHMDYQGDVRYGQSLRAAVGKGIRIHSVAASGLPAVGSLVFRQIAQYTRGKFIFVEYGGNVAASGKKHGVAGAKKSNNLDDILFDQIRDEVAHWGR